jgi:hypothetical protein
MTSPYLDLPVREESEVRAKLSMADVINIGSRSASRHLKTERPCPWCGADAPLPAKVLGRFIIECENDDCVASVSVAGDSPEDVTAKWNKRSAPDLKAELEACALELEKVWASLGQIRANKFVTAARDAIRRVALHD